MRGFFLLLLLTNVGLFGWQYYQRQTKPQDVDIYDGIAMVSDGLTLISELPEGKRPALRDGELAEAVDETQPIVNDRPSSTHESSVMQEMAAALNADEPRCYRVEGIGDKRQLDALINELKGFDAKNIEQVEQQVMQTNFWVMLPAYRNRRKANQAAELLAAQGVKDFFVVRSGEHENAVSLGVFSKRDRAELRFAEIDRLKRLRSPRIEPLEVPAKRYQVNFRLDNGQNADRLGKYLEKENMEEIKERQCE